jgi:hypothetical protein
VLKLSVATADPYLTYAQPWLYAELKNRGNSERILRILQSE